MQRLPPMSDQVLFKKKQFNMQENNFGEVIDCKLAFYLKDVSVCRFYDYIFIEECSVKPVIKDTIEMNKLWSLMPDGLLIEMQSFSSFDMNFEHIRHGPSVQVVSNHICWFFLLFFDLTAIFI